MNVLLIGLGGFGRNHLRAWCEMGFADQLFVAELRNSQHQECRKFNLSADRVTTDLRQFLPLADVVDIVTPTDSHFRLCQEAVMAGKDVFVEKPMTLTSHDASRLADLVEEHQRVLQVGYYYRFHPLSRELKRVVGGERLGQIRYLSGEFMGFKRARTDVGVTHTDAIHFLDLCNWLVGAPPIECYAVVRDHFNRGMEDCSIVLLEYAGGTLAKVESGYIQPGRWWDKVVPGAMTTKAMVVVGTQATAEVDFEMETLTVHQVHHEPREGTWWPVYEGAASPAIGTASPVEMLKMELTQFLGHVRDRSLPIANAVASGVVLARLMDGIYESVALHRPVSMAWSATELKSLGGSA